MSTEPNADAPTPSEIDLACEICDGRIEETGPRLLRTEVVALIRQHTAAAVATLRAENEHLRSLMENAARSINHLGELANVNPELHRTIKASAQTLLDAARKTTP